LTWTLLAAQLPDPINLKSKISNQRSINYQFINYRFHHLNP